ncbi:TetR/AcrR family transcriptional regulator [Oleomonas cavernae]|nr:TetR/AcrR family transcriptional regulator [Oleomonas cavernae]
MELFWSHGYYATSIDDLVRATGVSRHGLYAEFGDKRGLFVAAAEAYREAIVSPAFSPVEAPGAGLAQVRAYFETQINLAAARGLPGPGCLMANTMTESGPHDTVFRDLVQRHLDRLTAGFGNAVGNELRAKAPARPSLVARLASFLTVSTQGLWSVSRITPEPRPLRTYAAQLLFAVEERIQHDR